jgi:predicted oxidoreductase
MLSSERSISAATFFDTALAYGQGRSEAVLGRLVRANPGKRIHPGQPARRSSTKTGITRVTLLGYAANSG